MRNHVDTSLIETSIIYVHAATRPSSSCFLPLCENGGFEFLEMPYNPIFKKSNLIIEFNANGNDDLMVWLFDKKNNKALSCYTGKNSHGFVTNFLTEEITEIYATACLKNNDGAGMIFSLRAWSIKEEIFSINSEKNGERTFIKINEEKCLDDFELDDIKDCIRINQPLTQLDVD